MNAALIIPKKHGPSFKLKTIIGGKPTTRFVKEQNVNLVKRHLQNHRKFDDSIRGWVQLANDLAEIEANSSHERIAKKATKSES